MTERVLKNQTFTVITSLAHREINCINSKFVYSLKHLIYILNTSSV